MQTRKMGYAALAAVALAVLAVPTMAQAADVAAVVNGDKISKTQVMNLMKQSNVKPDDEQKVYPIAVDQLVSEQLLTTAAQKANVEKTPEFKKHMAELERQVYVEDYVKSHVTDDQVKAAYEKLKADNKGKQEIKARHILVKTEDEAKDIIKQLDNGAKFEDLAKNKSIDPSAKGGGEIGYFAQGDLVKPFSDAAFATPVGSYTKTPVQTQFGWHVILVEDKRTRVVPDLKDVQDRIRQGLSQEALKNLIQGLAAKADIKRYDMNGKPLPAGGAAPAAQ